jgi:hypothetical protein
VVRLRLANTQEGAKLGGPTAESERSDLKKHPLKRGRTRLGSNINLQALIDVNDGGTDPDTWRRSRTSQLQLRVSRARSRSSRNSKETKARNRFSMGGEGRCAPL